MSECRGAVSRSVHADASGTNPDTHCLARAQQRYGTGRLLAADAVRRVGGTKQEQIIEGHWARPSLRADTPLT